MLELRYLGHSAIELNDGAKRLVIDPFLTHNPKAACSQEEINPDYVIVTHAHADHFGDSVEISKRGALLLANAEIAHYSSHHGANAHAMNIGGTYKFPGGSVKFVPAWHSSSFSDGTYGGFPAGVVIQFGGMKIYHAGDTCKFSDMRYMGDMGLDLALLPIGDNYTMGPEEALECLELLRPKRVIPIHYNTFSVIEQDGDRFAGRCSIFNVDGKAMKSGDIWNIED